MNTDPLFVIMVITHQKNLGKPPKWILVYREYLEGFPWIKINVIYGGDEPSLEIKQILPENLQEYYKHVLASDHYEDLPQKVIAGVKHIFSEWPTVKGIFKIDDDVEIINMAKFIANAINLISEGIQYAGITTSVNYTESNHHIGKCNNPLLNISLRLNPNIIYCGGPLYFLGPESVKLISTSTEYQINTIYEDNLMGYILYTYGKITPVFNPLYYNLDDLIKPRNKRPPSVSQILTIHNGNHNNNLLMRYFQKTNLPIIPQGSRRKQMLTNNNELAPELEPELVPELVPELAPELTSGLAELDCKLGELDIGNENIDNSELEILDTKQIIVHRQEKQHRHNYKHISNQFATRKRLNFLLHQNSITNYITVHGGLCNNLFQISATWHYGLIGQGNFIRCFAGGINHKQLTDDIINYYQTYLFPKNNSIPPRASINHKPKYIDICQRCFEYLGSIYDPAKLIIHKDYFQHTQYINTFRLDTVWRHIINIDCMDELFLAHNDIDWQQRNNFFSVHVRLGDYLQSDIHNINYSQQISRVITELLAAPENNTARFIFFTDDYELLTKNICKYFLNADEYSQRYSIINEPDPVKTLRLMSACSKGHILSNSSFSIWGAILNPNQLKQVYLPRKWLNSPEGEDITESFKDISAHQFFY